jgi:hypothetical protein
VKRQVIGLVALALLCSAALGGDFVAPDQKIVGADKPISLGKLVRLRVSPLTTPPANLASSAYQWKVYDYDPSTGDPVELDDLVDLGNGSVFFGAGIQPKKLRVMCVATYLFLVKDKDVVQEVATRTVVLTAVVTIGDGTPTPPPTPVEPTFPDGTYKLSKTAYEAAVGKVKDPTARARGAAALAKSYKAQATALAAGTVADLKTALTKSKDANNQALKDAGIDLSAWDDFGTAMQGIVYDLYSSGSLKTPSDLGTAWFEVSAGLEKVK